MSIRDDFPSVRPRCYADSAAKTLTPHAVVAVMNEYYQSLDANVLRGLHRRAVQCTELVEEARRAVASTVNASAEHLVFCQNATHAINLLASGLQLPTGSRIVSSLLEHHSNLLPWMRLAQRCEGELLFLEPDANGVLELGQAQDFLSASKVALLALTQVSNVLGSEQPIAELCRLARDAGALSVVDAAQSVGHGLADVQVLGCDALVWSGHKSFGPTGTGALWMRAELLERLEPSMIGGGAIDALGPDGFVVAQEPAWRRFEVGTPNIAGLIGFGTAAHYLNEQLPRHRDGLAQLTRQAHHGLAALPGVRLLSRPNHVGIVSFCLDAWSPHAAAMALDEDFGVMLRSGHHCALPLMRHLGETKGCLRASFHVYSDEEDLDLLLAGVRALCEQQ